jgi:GNAT superfamily N-acetyltransferase
MRENTLRIADSFWTHDLGLTNGLGESEICCSVQNLYSGVQMLRRAGKLAVAVPPDQLDRVQSSMKGCSINEIFSANWLKTALGDLATKVIGPAEVNYADETTFRSPDSSAARELHQDDLYLCRSLQAALSAREAEESGFMADVFPAFGAFSGSMLCAAAYYRVWEPSIAHIMVATHPDHRRRGFARAAVGALAQDALKRGLILQWRALAWNSNSLTLARDLGFEHYCSTLYARLSTS